jgi:plasmid stabilization system protein ParE
MPQALRNLEAARTYITEFNPAAADRMARRLVDAGESLAEFPNRGRPASRGHRELALVPPYVIRYRVEGEKVFITGIKHGRQRPD